MKKLILALAGIAFMATATMADAPVAAVPTKVKMKIKAKEKDGLVKAKVAISHNMLTYDQAKKKGKEANFITHITATVGDKVVYDASTSQFLSKNPLIKFQFAGKKGDELKITYTQLKGEVFYATKKIK
jgi:sulfur-oxidizing protein SoxZ